MDEHQYLEEAKSPKSEMKSKEDWDDIREKMQTEMESTLGMRKITAQGRVCLKKSRQKTENGMIIGSF